MAFSFGSLGGGAGAGAASSGNASGAQVVQGPDLELIQTEGLGFLNLGGEAKLQFVSKWTELPLPTASLISIASHKGLVAAAGPDAVNIATTESIRKAITAEGGSDGDDDVRAFTPQIKIPLPMRVSQLAFTADESHLVLSAETGGGLAVYDVSTLVPGSTPKSVFELSTNGETLRSLAVNPMADKAELCALVTVNGSLLMADLQQRALRSGPNGQSVLRSQISCVAWSSKGKQLVAGCADGSLYQMTPDGQEKAYIPKPPQLGDYYVASLAWLENDVFLVVHNPTTPGSPSTYHLITRKAKAGATPEFVYQKLNDPVEPFADKAPHHTILRLRDFPPNLQDMLLVASTAVETIGLLTRSKAPLASNVPADKITNVFTTTELADDSKRAQLPMSSDYNDTFPIGVALDLSSTNKVPKPIPTDEMDESPGPLPGLWALNNEGVLMAWWVVYNESVRQGTTYPGLAAVDGGIPATPAAAAPPTPGGAAFSSPKAAGPAFGSNASPAGPAPAFGSSSALGSTSSPWGQASGAVVTTASPSQTPSFGAPSLLGRGGFGASSALGAKTSVWGSASKTPSAPAFGQSSFGTSSTSAAPSGGGFSSFASSSTNASPFGSAAAASKPAGASPFGAFNNGGQSGFASLGGSGGSSGGGSIFASGTSGNKSFGQSDIGSSVFGAPLKKEDKSTGGSVFGSSPFVLGTTFKADASSGNDNEKTPQKSEGGNMFGSGFGLSLTDTAKKPPAAAEQNDADMGTSANPAPTPTPAESEKPASTGLFTSTTPTTTPGPAGSRFFNPLTSSNTAAPTSLFGTKKEATSAPSGSAAVPSLFGKTTTENSTPSLFGKATGEAPKPSLFGKATAEAATPSLFGKATAEASTPLFGKAASGAPAPSLFGKPSGTTTAPTLFSKPTPSLLENSSGKPASSGGGLFSTSSGTGLFSGFKNPALDGDKKATTDNPFKTAMANAAKQDEAKKEAESQQRQSPPLPPDAISKAPYPLGDSSSSEGSFSIQSTQSAHSPTALSNEVASNSLAEEDAPLPPNPFASQATKPAKVVEPPLPPNPFAQPKAKVLAGEPPLPPDPFAKPKAKAASTETPSAVVPEDAPLPPDPFAAAKSQSKPKTEEPPAVAPGLFSSLNTASKPTSVSIFSSGTPLANVAGHHNPFANLPKPPLSPTTDGSDEDEFSEDGAEDDEGEDDERESSREEGEEDQEDDEGSGTDVGKDLSRSTTGFAQTPSFTTHGSFTTMGTMGAMDGSVNSGFSHIEAPRTQLFGEAPTLRPSRNQQGTSPRSPSPQRPPAKPQSGVAGRLFRDDAHRSFSAPGMASQLLRDTSRQGRTPDVAPAGMQSSTGLFASRRMPRDANLEEQRKADEARAVAETKELTQEDSYDVMDRELDEPLAPTRQLAECVYILDSDIAGGDTVASQAEAVYRDINRMVLVVKLNSRNIDAFLRGHSESERKTEDDLDDADEWVLCDIDALGAVVSRDLPSRLRQSRVKDEKGLLMDAEALLKEGSRLQTMHDEIMRVVQSQASADQAAAARSLPLSAEQAAQQNDLRRTFTQFMGLLVEAEQQIVLLRTKLTALAAAGGGSAAGANGRGSPVPTVNAVIRTISRMTAMAEKRSGDIDVLEAQIRKLNIQARSREGSPFSTPQKQQSASQKRGSLILAPGSGPRSAAKRSSVLFSSPGVSAQGTPSRKKLTGYTDAEKEQLRQKRAGRQRTLNRLRKIQQAEGPRYMPMDD